MLYSIFFAKLLGIYFVFASIGALIHGQQFKHIIHEILTSPLYIRLSGSLNLFLGLCIILPHPIWIAGWPVVITILGYLLFLRGAVRLLAPQLFIRLMKLFLIRKGILFASWVEFILGCYLVWAGFTQ